MKEGEIDWVDSMECLYQGNVVWQSQAELDGTNTSPGEV